MNNFFLLLKIVLLERFRSFAAKSGGKKYWWAWLILGIVFIPILAGIVYLMYSLGKLSVDYPDVNGLHSEYVMSALMVIAQIIVFIFGLVSFLNVVYFSRDSQILLPLPLKPQTVFFSKFAYVYFIELMTTAVIASAAILPFGIGAGLDIVFYLLLIPATLLIPLLPLLVASIVAIPLMYVMTFFKKRGVLSTILLIVIFSAAFLGYYMLIGGTSGSSTGEETDIVELLVNTLSVQIERLGSALPPNLWLSKSMSAGNGLDRLLNFVFSLGADAALFAVAFFISSAVYMKSISKQLENSKSTTAKGEISYASINRQLMLNDFKRIVRFPALGLSCFMQTVLASVLMLGMSFMFTGNETSLTDLPKEVMVVVPLGLATFMVFMILMVNVVASSAFSREGDAFQIYKYIPLQAETIVKSKLNLAFVFNAVSSLISVTIISIVLRLGILNAVVMLLYLNVVGLSTASIGVYSDLSRPRLKWKSINEAVKNNRASLIVMGYGLVNIILNIILIVIGYAIYSSTKSEMAFILIWAIMFIIALCEYLVIKNTFASKIARMFEKIEV